ncbi:Inorganic phosphate transporter 1-1 [Hondaea fermentalgiana]|uniref:Inorganic phosphate transporter 1-1 n=1 Tax=Hondaea fermentalgiana TaxID=2315210 RepID=A0A2R5GUH2_9STRA|nr:Inorganic phosphate transporter 1-1 [Hondaea fermentalgiana]|eukprot:GBG33408.1 Inorganic phosphate transporter 1-1 [Hondaea fermentalgiana]
MRQCCGVELDSIFVVTSLANLAAGYNLAIAGHTLYLIESEGEELSEVQTSMVASAAFVGAVTGQIVMGYAGERLGIVRGLVLTFVILICGCLAGAFLCWAPHLFTKLAISRFVVGVGAGGVYPLAAIASASMSPNHDNGSPGGGEGRLESFNGRRVMLTFSFQGVGQLMAPLWVLVLDTVLPHAKPLAWRVALLTGSVPAGFAIGRLRRVFEDMVTQATAVAATDSLSDGVDNGDVSTRDNNTNNNYRNARNGAFESTRINSNDDIDDYDDDDIDEDEDEDELENSVPLEVYTPPASFQSRWSRGNLLKLVGTGGTWFLFDVLFYGNVVFSPFILNLVFEADEAEVAALTTIVSAIALPGLLLASYYSDKMGRKQMQVFGFVVLTVLFLGLAGLLSMGERTATPFIFALYCATFFFYNFGPNATTFCLPAETFDPEVRSFFNGLSAALGKAGAFLGAVFFKFVMDKTSLTFVMLCSAVVSAMAVLLTVAFVNVRSQHDALHHDSVDGAFSTSHGSEAAVRETELPVRIPRRDNDSIRGGNGPDYVDLGESGSTSDAENELIRI